MNSNFAPWQKKGRWYKIKVSSNGTTNIIDSSELDGVSVSSTLLYFPKKFIVNDVHSFNYGIVAGKSLALYTMGMSSDGKRFISLPPANYNFVDIWVFGYFDDTATTQSEE